MSDKAPDLVHLAFAALGYGVLEQIGASGAFAVHGEPPPWLAQVWPQFQQGRALLRPQERFPFIENFLIEANGYWAAPDAPNIRSGPWEERLASGDPVSLDAIALLVGDRKLLLIERLGAAYEEQKAVLQRARETLLAKEELEREVRRRTQWIRDREEETVLRLAWAAEYRDGDTGAHIRRIGLAAAVVAEQLGWNKGACDDLRLAATMHDVGKIGLPDGILLKPGPLTPEERSVMQTHTVIGAAILQESNIPLIQLARDIAVGHHEWWNGAGYPRRAASEDIPEAARIVAVADVYDALLHDRVYRPAMPEPTVLSYLEEHRGTHFEPRILDAFMEVLPRIRRYRKNTSRPVPGELDLPSADGNDEADA